MKNPITNTRGTVLIFSLLVVFVGAVVLAGWATMLATRSLFPDSATVAQKNRIAVANGRAIAREYVLRNITNTNFPATNYSLAKSAAYSDGFTNWGGFTNAASTNYTVNIFSNSDIRNTYNPFSPGERDGFEILFSANVTTSSETNPWNFRIRGRSPIYGGNPLVLQRPRSTAPAGITVFTNTLMWTNSTSTTPLPFTPIGGKNAEPAATCYSGNISITPTRMGGNFIDGNSTTGIVNDSANNTVTINLNPTQPRAGNGYYLVGNSTTTLILKGEPYSGGNSTLPSLHVIYDYPGNTRNLTITLDGDNKCRTYLSIIQGNATATSTSTVTMTTTNATANPFRIGILRQGGGTMTINNATKIQGGIRTDANLSVASSLRLETDDYEAGLNDIADRIIWLEDNPQ